MCEKSEKEIFPDESLRQFYQKAPLELPEPCVSRGTCMYFFKDNVNADVGLGFATFTYRMANNAKRNKNDRG